MAEPAAEPLNPENNHLPNEPIINNRQRTNNTNANTNNANNNANQQPQQQPVRLQPSFRYCQHLFILITFVRCILESTY